MKGGKKKNEANRMHINTQELFCHTLSVIVQGSEPNRRDGVCTSWNKVTAQF